MKNFACKAKGETFPSQIHPLGSASATLSRGFVPTFFVPPHLKHLLTALICMCYACVQTVTWLLPEMHDHNYYYCCLEASTGLYVTGTQIMIGQLPSRKSLYFPHTCTSDVRVIPVLRSILFLFLLCMGFSLYILSLIASCWKVRKFKLQSC